MSNKGDIFDNLLRFSNEVKLIERDGKVYIWDPIRKKYLIKQEEELVRQLVLQYFIKEQNWPEKLVRVEKQIDLAGAKKRFDIVLYSSVEQALILIECKSPSHKLDQKVFDQISNYNLTLKIPYLIVTNGINSYLLKIDFTNNNYEFINSIPKQNNEQST